MLIDSHCHLDFPDFAGPALAQALARADRAGVGGMVTISTSLAGFEKVRAIAETRDNLWCSVGIHPHEAAAEPIEDAARLIAAAAHPKVVGIGETGLDYFYEHAPKEDQQRNFRAHIAAARETGLPLIVHTRDADADTIAILAEEQAKGAFPGLIHCFSAGPELAQAVLAMGFYISLSGILTFNKAESLRDLARTLPLDRLLVETDSPYLAPVPHRGKRNEPAFVVHTAVRLAELRGVTADEIAAATTENFFRLFARAERPKPGAAS